MNTSALSAGKRTAGTGRWAAYGMCVLTFVAIGFAEAALGPSLPMIAGSVGLPLAGAGVLRAVRQGGSLVAQLPSGWLLDRVGTRPVILAGCLAVAAGLVGVVMVPDLGGMLLASLVLGVGSGFLEVGPNAAVGLMFSGSAASAALAGLHAFYGAGSTLGPGAVGAFGWQSAYWGGALLCLCVAGGVVGVRMPRQGMVAVDKGRVAWKRLLPLGLFVLIYNGLEFAVGDWLYVQLKVGMGVDAALAVQAATLFWLMLTAGRLLAVQGLQRFGRQLVMAGALGLSFAGMVGLTITTLPVPVVFVALSVVALGFAPIHPICVSLASDSHRGAEGRAIGVLGALAAVGSMVVPVLHGWAGAGRDGGMIVSLVGVALLIGIGFFWLRLWGGKTWAH